MWQILAIGIIGILGAAVTLVYLRFRDKKVAEEILAHESALISISVPKNNEKTPLAAEQMFASLHGLLRPGEEQQQHMSFEIASQDKFTQFYIHVPKNIKDFVEGQIYAQYPTVDIKDVEDYTNIELDNMEAVGTELSLSKEDVYPIKTFQSFEVDPLAGITGVLSKVSGAERIWIQVLVQPVDDSWQDKGVQLVNNIRLGISDGSILSELRKEFFAIIGHTAKHAISPPKSSGDKDKKKDKKEEKETKQLSGPVETAMTAVETKIQKLGFATKIRILAMAKDREAANSKLMAVVGAFKQFNTTNLNGFKAGNIVQGEQYLPIYQLRSFGEGGSIFNIEELASIYHFPHVSVETPSIVWAGSKKGEPPANLPIEGVVSPDELTVFAITNFRDYRTRFGIKKQDRLLHTYIVGKTGTGKSNLQKNMIIDDIKEGRGVAVVDPHGDSIKAVLNFIPEERINDVIYLNPADYEYPIGFNLLENVDPELKNIVASGLMSVFTKLWENVWSARMEYILRNCILALLEYPNATFISIMRLLIDKKFRSNVLEYVKDPVIRDFFINEYEKYDPKFRTEAIAPIQNKVGQFLSSTIVRNIIGQQKSTIDISKIMNEGKILLIDLTTGRIGEDNSALLGAMMITKIQLAAMGRADMPEEERKDFYLYVDEFQNFATESFAVILSEARKYHLNLVMANQYIAQLSEEVSDAIFGNVGTLISFRVGASDAEKLVKEYEPVFDANDLVNLDNYHIYIKMAIDGVTCPAFSAVTLPPIKEHHGCKNDVIEFSRRTYGRPRDEVEQEILKAGDIDTIDGAVSAQVNIPSGDIVHSEVRSKSGGRWYVAEDKEKNGVEREDSIVIEKPQENVVPGQKNIVLDQSDGGQDGEQGGEDQSSLIMTNEAHEIAGKSFDNQKGQEEAKDIIRKGNKVDGAVELQEGETVKIEK